MSSHVLQWGGILFNNTKISEDTGSQNIVGVEILVTLLMDPQTNFVSCFFSFSENDFPETINIYKAI